MRRFRRAPARPTVILPDASFDVVSVLEEHRIAVSRADHPERAAPLLSRRRRRGAVRRLHGRNQRERAGAADSSRTTRRASRSASRGSRSSTSRAPRQGRQPVRRGGRARAHRARRRARAPTCCRWPAPPLYTNIDLDLQRYVASIFGDSLQGGVVAIDPKTGAVLALVQRAELGRQPLHRRRAGGSTGIRCAPIRESRSTTRRCRASIRRARRSSSRPPSWRSRAGAVTMNDHMPITCTGGLQYGNRATSAAGTSAATAASRSQGAIAKSCDVYFYQLGLKLGLARLLAGGVDLGFTARPGIDLPEERRPRWPDEHRILQPAVRPERLDAVGRAQPGDRPGRERADHPQHGALLHGARHRRHRGAAGDREAGSRSASDSSSSTPSRSRSCARRWRAWWRRHRRSASKIQGVVLAGKTGTAQSRQVRRERQGAELLVVRRLRAGRTIRRSSWR